MPTDFARYASEEYGQYMFANHAVVVIRDGEEIEWFHCHKDAGAWMQHVYGWTPREGRDHGLLIETSKARRGPRAPRAGDPVTYRGGGSYSYLVEHMTERDAGGKRVLAANPEITGILDHSYGRDSFGITFSASAFREHSMVSCSGGPVPYVEPDSLTCIGLKRVAFWCWHDGYSGADKGGTYYITLPHWLWNGEEKGRHSE